MCNVLLPPGVKSIAVIKYTTSYQTHRFTCMSHEIKKDIFVYHRLD